MSVNKEEMIDFQWKCNLRRVISSPHLIVCRERSEFYWPLLGSRGTGGRECRGRDLSWSLSFDGSFGCLVNTRLAAFWWTSVSDEREEECPRSRGMNGNWSEDFTWPGICLGNGAEWRDVVQSRDESSLNCGCSSAGWRMLRCGKP